MILFAMRGRHADKNKQGAPDDNDGGGGYAAATAAAAVGDNDDDNGADDDEGDVILFAMKERHWCGRAQAGKQGRALVGAVFAASGHGSAIQRNTRQESLLILLFQLPFYPRGIYYILYWEKFIYKSTIVNILI